MFSKNILNFSLLVIIVIIYTYFYNDNIFLPHPRNEDDFKNIIIPEDNIIGISPTENIKLFEIKKNIQKDFYTSSTLLKPENFNNKINFKKNNINDNYIKNTKKVDILNNKYNINIYNKDKIMNGKDFLIGNNLIKGYEK